MAKKNYKAIADAIVQAAGGAENIVGVTHCMTRLRLQLRDSALFKQEIAKTIDGVLNVVIQNGEYQFVIGQDVPSLYEEFEKDDRIHTGGSVEDNQANEADKKLTEKKNVLNTVMAFIGGVFSPVIPVLVAGGLTGAVLTVLTSLFKMPADSGAYTIFYALNQAAFYFLPIFIGFSAATRLKSNGYLGAFLAAVLLYSTINNAEGLSFAGVPVAQVAYNATVFPIILGVLFMSYLYKFLQKVTPVFLRTILVPLVTMLVSVPVTLLILGPIGNFAGTYLANGVLAIYNVMPAVAVMIIGAATCWLVFFGMNNAMYPIVFALLAQVGSDPLICTGMAPANVAVGGACLAAALISKKADDKSVAVGAGLTALCGITEPGVYGVLFTKRYPLYGAMIGGALGGLIGGMFHMTQYVISTPGFISFAAYIDPSGSSYNLTVSMVVMVIATAAAFAVTYILGRRQPAD